MLGGLVLAGNPLRCGCAASWVGAWLRRWTAEVGGGERGARASARRSQCVLAAPLAESLAEPRAAVSRPLLALDGDEAECHASALAGAARRAPPRPEPPLIMLLLLPYKLIYTIICS